MESELIEREPQSLAAELQEIEEIIDEQEQRAKELRAALLDQLQHSPFKKVVLKDGTSYVIGERDNLVIKNKISAQKWAFENPEARMKLDAAKALEIARMGKSKLFDVETTYHLRVTKPKNNLSTQTTEA